jgi:hypothetical protein
LPKLSRQGIQLLFLLSQCGGPAVIGGGSQLIASADQVP